MARWPPSPDAIERPAYRSLARHLTTAIEAGELMPGDRLPTHRDLAWRLGLSVQTVSRAYDALTRSGLVAGEVGRGTFVTPRHDDDAPPYHRIERGEAVIDCSMLTPVLGQPHAAALSRTFAALARGELPGALSSFRPREALRPHVEAALPWLARCGVRPRASQVIPTNGSTAAMAVALMTAAAPDDIVVAETLSHHTLPGLCRALGLRLAGLPADTQGICPDALARACETQSVRILYVLPGGQSAGVSVMSAERRQDICRVARHHGVLIVENDAWGPLETTRPPPLAALAPELTFYITGLSKCLSPALRHGWLIAPEAHTAAARARHLATNWMASAVVAEIAARWLTDGTAAELLTWQRRALARRNRTAGRQLAGVPHRRTPRGLHLWLPLPGTRDEAAFVDEARGRGVALAPGAAFTVDGAPAGGVRLCLGAATEAELAIALGTVRGLAGAGTRTD